MLDIVKTSSITFCFVLNRAGLASRLSRSTLESYSRFTRFVMESNAKQFSSRIEKIFVSEIICYQLVNDEMCYIQSLVD